MKTIHPLTLIFFLAFLLPAESQVSISSAADTARIGDRITVKVMAKTSDQIDEMIFDTPKGSFEIISQKVLPPRERRDYQVFETHLVISFFSTGNFTVGPITVNLMEKGKVRESKKSNSIEFTIQSVLTEKDKDIKNLKDVISMRGNPYYFLRAVIVILALLALGVFLFWYVKKRKRKKEMPPPPVPSPLEELESGFQKLLEKKYTEKGKFKIFFIQLTDLVKHYLSREYGFNARDLTSSETMSVLKKREPQDAVRHHLDQLFSTSDLVKFAKYIPAPAEIERTEQGIWFIISARKEKEKGETESTDVSIPE